MKINKKLLSSFILGACALSLTACDNNDKNIKDQSQESTVSKNYKSDSVTFKEVLPLVERNVKDPKDMALFDKVTPDEFFAMTFFKSSGFAKDDNFNVKQAVQFTNSVYPQSPVIRENVPFYQSYARSLAAYIFTNSGGYEGDNNKNKCLAEQLQKAGNDTGNVIVSQDTKSWDILKACNALPTGEGIKPYEFKDVFIKGSTDDLKYTNLIAQTVQLKNLKDGDSMSGEISKLGVDEFYALDMAAQNKIQPLDKEGKNVSLEDSTLGDIIRGFDYKYPGAPILRGDISFNDSYYRDEAYFSLMKKTTGQTGSDYNKCTSEIMNTPLFSARVETIYSFKVSQLKEMCQSKNLTPST